MNAIGAKGQVMGLNAEQCSETPTGIPALRLLRVLESVDVIANAREQFLAFLGRRYPSRFEVAIAEADVGERALVVASSANNRLNAPRVENCALPA